MPKLMMPEEKNALEEAILLPKDVGRFDWPIEVEAMGVRAALRLLREKARITYDWLVPERLREAVGQNRITRQVPASAGRSVAEAKTWTRDWLRQQVLDAELKLQNGGRGVDTGVPNDVPLSRVLDRFAASKKYEKLRQRNPEGADQWDLWMDFFRATLGEDWRLYNTSPDVLAKVHEAYQKPWTRVRVLRDGTRVTSLQDTRAGHNTAAKVVRFFRAVVEWALSEPDGAGRFLLDADPFMRVRAEDMPQEHSQLARTVGVAPDAYARAMFRHARGRGAHGQFAVMVAGEAVTGRRVSEWRVLRRDDVLTGFEEVRKALAAQGCRKNLPDDHIPESELDQTARDYLALSGVVVRFRGGKQAAARPRDAAQYDRVFPLGPWMGGLLLTYIEEQWKPRGLPLTAPLFPAAMDPTVPTDGDLVMTWWERTERRVAKLEPDVRIPAGRTHTLRRRFRSTLRKSDPKSLAFLAGWTLRRPGAMDGSYLPVHRQDVLEVVQEAEAALKLS